MARQPNILKQMNQLACVGAWEVDPISEKVYWSAVTKKIHDVDADFEPVLATGINFYLALEARQIEAAKDYL